MDPTEYDKILQEINTVTQKLADEIYTNRHAAIISFLREHHGGFELNQPNLNLNQKK
jgi:hypothetical protein